MTVKDAESFLHKIDDHPYWNEITRKKDAPAVAKIVSILQETGYSYKKAIEILRKCELAVEDIAKIN